MEVLVKFSSMTDPEKRELAGLLLEQAHEQGLAVRLPERTIPYLVPEAAEALGVSIDTIYKMIKAERLVTVLGLSKKMIVASSVHAVRDGEELTL